MVDFNLDTNSESQPIHFALFLLLYMFNLYLNRDFLYDNCRFIEERVKQKRILIGSVLLLSIAAYTRGDFYHYYDQVKELDSFGYSHMEAVYRSIILYVNNNYLFFRIIVWGGAFMAFYHTSKRLDLDIRLTLFVLFCCYILYFNYARATLSFALYFLGVSYIVKPLKIKVISYTLGCAVIFVSSFFHSSSLFLLILTPIVFVKYSKKTVKWCAIIFPLFVVAFRYLWNRYLLTTPIIDDELFNAKFDAYTLQEIERSGSIKEFIVSVIEYSRFYIPLYLLYRHIDNTNIEPCMRKLYFLVLGIILFASCFLFLGLGNMVFYYRFLYMSFIPIALLLSYMKSQHVFSQTEFKFCIYLSVFYIVYDSLYAIYLRML